MSLEILILLIPRLTASRISSSRLFEPPCKTNGIEMIDLISFSKSNFNSGFIPFG